MPHPCRLPLATGWAFTANLSVHAWRCGYVITAANTTKQSPPMPGAPLIRGFRMSGKLWSRRDIPGSTNSLRRVDVCPSGRENPLKQRRLEWGTRPVAARTHVGPASPEATASQREEDTGGCLFARTAPRRVYDAGLAHISLSHVCHLGKSGGGGTIVKQSDYADR